MDGFYRFRMGVDVVIIRQDGSEARSMVKGIEIFVCIESAEKRDNFGLLFQRIQEQDIQMGDGIQPCLGFE